MNGMTPASKPPDTGCGRAFARPPATTTRTSHTGGRWIKHRDGLDNRGVPVSILRQLPVGPQDVDRTRDLVRPDCPQNQTAPTLKSRGAAE